MRKFKAFLVIFGILLFLTAAGLTIDLLNASSGGDDVRLVPDDVSEPETVDSYFFCSIEIRDDLHRPDAFFGIVETFPAVGEWPVIETQSHTAETLGYTLIQIRGISVPSQFADRTRTLISVERERARFDQAMAYTWALLSQSETLVLRNPEPTENGTVLCDVAIRIGGHELDLAQMLISDGHARPAGNWDWGARDVAEVEDVPK